MKKLTYYIIFLISGILPALVCAASIDTPHNQTNGIHCSTCHSYSAWWQYSPADTKSTGYANFTSVICLSCHGANGPAPIMLRHDSVNLSDKYGLWSTACIDCHDPHQQDQLSWRSTDSGALFLVTGHISTIDNGDGTSSYSFQDNGNNTTTINIDPSATIADPGWDIPSKWNRKNDNQTHNRGLIFVHSTSEAYNTYPVLSATSTTITVGGIFNASVADPRQDSTFGLIYGQLIRSSIMAGTVAEPNILTPHDVKFFNPKLLHTVGGFTDQETPRQGICQVCHTKTTNWTEDGAHDDHNANQVCTDCHLRQNAFKPNSTGGHTDGDGTFAWDDSCVSCHNPDGSSEIIADVHQLGKTNSCTLCHLDQSGGALDPSTSASNATIGSLPHHCTECHTDTYTKHHATDKAVNGDCGWCHNDPRQGWQTDFGITGSMPRQLSCRECHVKPDGTGLTIYKLSYNLTPATTITFPGDDLSQAPANAPMVISTVMDGTHGTVNHHIDSTSLISIYNYGTCFSCHNGTTAAAVNVWHARPRYSDLPPDSSDDPYHNHFDVLRYAPGRSVFNLWRGDGEQGEPYFSHENEYYDDGDAEERGENFYDAQRGHNLIQWNWGKASSPFSMTTIPCFSINDADSRCGGATAQVPTFDDGPVRDTITPLLTSYDGSQLMARASNVNGDLSVIYDGGQYPMQEDSPGTWSLTLPLASLTAASLDIHTSNPLGNDLLAEPVCAADPIQVNQAVWTPNDFNNGTLHIEAATSNGAASQVTARYNDTTVPLTWNGTIWTLDNPTSYPANIEIASTCGQTTALVSNLADTISATASWDGNTIHVTADNTSISASLSFDYGASSTAMQETGANQWSLDYADTTYHKTARIWSTDYGQTDISVNNTAPHLYPPDCGAGNNTDHIISPLKKATFNTETTELEITALNNLDDAGNTSLYMTYSETEDGVQRYNMTRSEAREFKYQGAGFTWQTGASVSVWSEDAAGTVQAIVCQEPVINSHGGDVISQTTAQWQPTTRTLTVEAVNDLEQNASLYVEYLKNYNLPMTWNAASQHWQLTLTDIDYSPSIIITSDQDARLSAAVQDMTPDPLHIINALWLPNSSGTGDLFLQGQGSNGPSNQLFADYGNNHGLPLVWDPVEELWQLNLSGVSRHDTVTLWSAAPGGVSGPVTDMSGLHQTLQRTPECVSCHSAPDTILDTHMAHCDTCHASSKPAVLNALTSGAPLECTDCHLPIDETIRVQSVSFNYPGSPAIQLKDHNLPPDDNLITAPEYIAQVSNYPAAYIEDTPIVIQAVFTADSGIDSAQISSSLFPAQTVQFSNGVSAPLYFTLPPSVSDAAGSYFLTLDWQVCDKNASNAPDCAIPQPIHESQHLLDITHGQPAGSAPFYAQALQWACQWSADAADNDGIVKDIFDGIWALGDDGYEYVFPFSGRTHDKVGDILRQRQGACGEWAIFMQRCVESQGIDVYTTAIFPDIVNGQPYSDYRVEFEALGHKHGPWVFPDHTFIVYGGDINNFSDPNLGTVYDPTYHLTGKGWGGYEDVVINQLGDGDQNTWQDNPGFGTATDVLNSKLLRVIDDWNYYYGMDDEGYDDASLYYYPRDGAP